MAFWGEMLDRIVSGKGNPPPFVRELGLPPLEKWEPGRTWARWEVDPRFFHDKGAVFGGYLAALADSALGLVTSSVLEDGEAFTTSDLRMSFFRPVKGGTLRIEARVIHRGRRQISVEAEFKLENGKLAAKAVATQVIV